MTKAKTLSQQICELCGIKPKTIAVDCPARTSGIQLQPVWIDFENPENFVKLLELKSGDCRPRIGVLIHNAYFLGTDFTRVECLKILIKILCYPDNQGSQVLDKLKQSIRDYDDWVWG